MQSSPDATSLALQRVFDFAEPAHVSVPLVGYALANATACLIRRGGRGFVDLMVGR